jgi:hypothetical protein
VTPLKVTVSWLAMLLKPLPLIVTEEPTEPDLKLIEPTRKTLDPAVREMDVIFPLASYVY